MNKLFIAVFVVAIGASYGFFLDNLPFLCKEENDCGAHKCCFAGKVCLPKLQRNMPCGGRLESVLKCGCDDGLECKVVKVINATIGQMKKTVKIRQCREVDEIVVPEEIDYDEEGLRQKRFLPDLSGIAGAIGGAIGGAVDTLFRKCTDGSECGDKRCCASYPFVGKRCIVPFLRGAPCPSNGHCCGEGLECRSLFTISTSGEEGSPTKRPIDLKFCQKISDPVAPPTEVEIDE